MKVNCNDSGPCLITKNNKFVLKRDGTRRAMAGSLNRIDQKRIIGAKEKKISLKTCSKKINGYVKEDILLVDDDNKSESNILINTINQNEIDQNEDSDNRYSDSDNDIIVPSGADIVIATKIAECGDACFNLTNGGRMEWGTMGLVVEDISGKRFIITSENVLASRKCKVGDLIACDDLVVGKLVKWGMGLAIVEISAKRFGNTIRGGVWKGGIGIAMCGRSVKKFGAGTKLTYGNIYLTDVVLNFDCGERLNNVFIVNGIGCFAGKGDAGALVLTKEGVAVGMLFASGADLFVVMEIVQVIRSVEKLLGRNVATVGSGHVDGCSVVKHTVGDAQYLRVVGIKNKYYNQLAKFDGFVGCGIGICENKFEIVILVNSLDCAKTMPAKIENIPVKLHRLRDSISFL